jgi:hypothetical protein
VRALKQQYADWHLSVKRRQQPKKGNHDDGGHVARRGMIRRANLAPHKGLDRQRPGRDNIASGTSRGSQGKLECNNGIWDRDVKEQVGLRSKRSFNKTFKQTVQLKAHEANGRDFHQPAKNECQGIVEGSAPSETKVETAHRVKTGNTCTGAPTTPVSFARTDRKRRVMVIHLVGLAPYEGANQDERC